MSGTDFMRRPKGTAHPAQNRQAEARSQSRGRGGFPATTSKRGQLTGQVDRSNYEGLPSHFRAIQDLRSWMVSNNPVIPEAISSELPGSGIIVMRKAISTLRFAGNSLQSASTC